MTMSDGGSSSDVFLGFILLLISLLCLGTWPAILRLSCTPAASEAEAAEAEAAEAEAEAEAAGVLSASARNRDTRFAYLDFALSYVVSSCVPLGLGILVLAQKQEHTNSGTSPLSPPSSPSVLILFALVGGSLLSLGNMSMQWATTVFGAPLTTVVAIQASLTVLLGTSINFVLEPQKTVRPDFLLVGVVVFLVAVGLATRAHLLYGEEQRREQTSSDGIELLLVGQAKHHSYSSLDSNEEESLEWPASVDLGLEEDGSVRPVLVESPLHVKRTTTTHSPKLALLVSIFGGSCFGFFSPAFNIAVNDPFDWSGSGGGGGTPLSVPVANLWFSLAFALASFAGNLSLMYHPPAPFGLPRTTITAYICSETFSARKLAILAGLLCGSANLLQFKGGSLVGFATADLVQAFPLVSTIWDVALFGEFRRAGKTVIFYILAMYAMYACGIGLLLCSSAAAPRQ